MAPIDRQRWQLLEPLVDEALDLPEADRDAWFAALAARDDSLAVEVRELLAGLSALSESGFMAAPLVVTDGQGTVGAEIGGYQLRQQIGSGGMGSVWLAEPTTGGGGDAVAIKLLKLALQTPTGHERFRREAAVLARLTHPGVGRLLDTGISPAGQPYLVLEYVAGQRIDEWVAARQLAQADILRLALQVIDAVAHAHQHRIVHRDIKPSNILVTASGATRLLDFGIAKLLNAAESGEPDLTAPREWLGTPDFAAPEQVRCEVVSPATDVYALGVLLYLLLSGRHPTAPSRGLLSDRVQAVLRVIPRRLNLGAVDAVVHTALQKDAAHRYPDARAMGDDVSRLLRGEAPTARH